MQYSSEFWQIVTAIIIAFGGFQGWRSFRHSFIDKRESVETSMGKLNERLTKEIERLDTERRRDQEEAKQREQDLQQELANLRLASSKREQQLQEQITRVQRDAAEREQALQGEITKLYKRITEYTEEIDVLRQQLKRYGAGQQEGA